jgi:hypothetical protein
MTPENFCYWLKGIFEIQEAGLDKNEKRSIRLTEAQIEMINTHLNYVFQPKVIAAPSFDHSSTATGTLDLSSPKAFIC